MSFLPHMRRSHLCTAFAACTLALALAFAVPVGAEIDPTTGDFSYSGGGGIDSILGQIAVYLITLNRQEGRAYISREVEEGIGGYQLRFFDNGNKLVDPEDWLSAFDSTGLYDYYDTNSGDPGRRVVDAYYGTVTYVGTSATSHRGQICATGEVEGEPCCCTDFDCPLGQACSANTCVDL